MRYSDGALIELAPGLAHVFMMLGMKRPLNGEEFALVYERFMAEIKRLEEKGLLPEDLVEVVATPFAVPNLPAIPEKFADEIDDGAVKKIYLTGEVSFSLVKEYPHLETVEPEEEEGEEYDGEVVIDETDRPEGEGSNTDRPEGEGRNRESDGGGE